MTNLENVIDRALEATIVGSFSEIGIATRRRTQHWPPVDADLSGQLAVITGATSGIGRATAAGLLALGADVVMTSRSEDRARAVAAELERQAHADAGGRKQGRPPTASGAQLDTADFDSVRAMVGRLRREQRQVDMLIHNAGALTSTYETNEQGIERTVASHLIGPYLLTRELRSSYSPGARVLFMSSGGMYTQRLDVADLEMPEDRYRGAVAYARAKRAQVELVAYLGPVWAPDVILHAMHPGWVDTPGVDAGIPGFGKLMGPILRSAEQGADTMVWLAAGQFGDARPGQFWLDRRPRATSYLPGTSTDDDERRRLVEWLDDRLGLDPEDPGTGE